MYTCFLELIFIFFSSDFFSNQVLYYADRKQLKVALKQIDELLNPDGLVYFTMLGTKSYYYDCSTAIPNSDLRRITLTGRLNEVDKPQGDETEEDKF